MLKDIKIFSAESSEALAKQIALKLETTLGCLVFEKFSDGEYQPNIRESVRGKTVFFVQSTFAPVDNLMGLLMMIDAAKRASAKYVVAIIPYYGFARMDRKDKPRVPIGAKLVADLITTAGADRIMTMDLHSPQIQGFFNIPVDHLEASAIFLPYISKMQVQGKYQNLIFASPDMGSSKRVRNFANHFKTDLVICDKHREVANEVSSIRVIGDVQGKDVIIIDDIVDTASTLTKAADELLEKGALSVSALCTHAVMSGSAYQKIEASALSELVVTDTIPLREHSAKIKVLSVDDLFATAIRCVVENRSISDLFV
ncbi:MAG: ribose-phosphate pyrophosphokinase [Chitinophagales bacterium]|nr:ribose-phosphate pyrophosphokinase [Bacteroidota bacterium]